MLAWVGALALGGCATFQTGASEPLDDVERVLLPGRGQLKVIERNPGAAETVLLVHGYGASSASFTTVIPVLAERYHVLAVDLPGYGRSDKRAGEYTPAALADVLAEVLAQKRVARVHLVGHSFGAAVALAFALRHRDKLARLAIVSGWIYDEQLYPFMRWSWAPGMGELLFSWIYREALGERLYYNFYDPALVEERVVDDVSRNLAKPGAVAAALATARGMRAFAAQEADYRLIDAPTLVLWGREDRVARPAFGERLARDLPRARWEVLPRCGHIPMLECGGETAAALATFFAEAR